MVDLKLSFTRTMGMSNKRYVFSRMKFTSLLFSNTIPDTSQITYQFYVRAMKKPY